MKGHVRKDLSPHAWKLELFSECSGNLLNSLPSGELSVLLLTPLGK